MRLWHSTLIPLLDGKRLCDLHMSCCNLRGNGWGKRNVAINYLYDDELGEDALAVYHMIVLKEMANRGYKFQDSWWDSTYCGKNRSLRAWNGENLEAALRRNIPLKGHTRELFENDVKALQERGLNIECMYASVRDVDGMHYVYSVTDGHTKVKYDVTQEVERELLDGN